MAKTLPGYETHLLIPAVEIDGVPWIITPTGLVNYEAPTVAALNAYLNITKPSDANASQGGNISTVVLDDLNLGLTASDTDSAKTVCSKGNTEDLTLYNFDDEFNFRVDEDPAADTTANLARNLTRAPDVAYFHAHRVVGQYDSTEAAAIGQEWDLYYVNTDVQVTGYADQKALQYENKFIPKGVVNVRYTLVA